jgi:exopolyphosphatase/guanosine-5'-triphosphate,3'-diphosphate pyrophosphatase
MTKPVAAIDLGTNTFHLLIAEKSGQDGYREILKRVDPVKLGEGGINSGIIAEPAFQRGLAMLATYAILCREHGAGAIMAIATSAIRSASNGQAFAKEVKKQTGISITIINGDREAQYIYQGVRAAGCLSEHNSLIIDIGGGSVEFILCTDTAIRWKQSFEIGAARLMALFHETDPVPEDARDSLLTYLSEKLKPLAAQLRRFPTLRLIGSSGAFETFAEMIDPGFDVESAITRDLPTGALNDALSWLIASSHNARASHPGIAPLRVDMIVSAALITRFVMELTSAQKVTMTTYSLKEGVISELLTASA